MFRLIRILWYVVVSVAVIVQPTTASLSKINQPLEIKLKNSSESDLLPAFVLMQQRPDLTYLRESVQGVPRNDRTEIVWSELNNLAVISQAEVLEFLNLEQKRKRVNKIKPVYICNGIIISAKPSVILELSRRNDIMLIMDDSVRSFPVPNDFDEPDELDDLSWKLRRIGADIVWADGYTGENIIVASIDTGVDYTNQNLSSHLWDGGDEYPLHGYDFHNDDDDPMDTAGHGTGVALLIAGDGTTSDTSGVAPDAILMILKVREDLATGIVSSTWLAQDFVLDPANGVDLTNMSLGWGQPEEGDRTVWRSNYTVLDIAGIINVKSAGNNRASREPPDAISVPGGVPSPWRHPDEVEEGEVSGLITVGATTQNDTYTFMSSPGPVTWMDIDPFFDYPYDIEQGDVGLIKPDLAAPSGGVTSQAAPMVSGVIALMLSKFDLMLPAEVDSIIETTALDLGDPGKDNDYGAGLVQAVDAVDAIWMPTGTLEGFIEDDNTGLPLEDGIVFLAERQRRQDSTDVDGYFNFDAQPGTYTVKVKKSPSPEYVIGTVTINEDEVSQIDGIYPSGLFSVQPESLVVELVNEPEDSRILSFENTGSLYYDLQLEVVPEVPDTVGYLQELGVINISDPTQTELLYGLTYNGGIFYVTGVDAFNTSGWIFMFDDNGTYLGSYAQQVPHDTLGGMQDLACDGEYLWGGVGDSLYAFDPETGIIERRFEGPHQFNTSLAWDYARHVLWVAYDDNDIYAIDVESETVVDTILNANDYSIYGLAFYPDDDTGSQLWMAVHSASLGRKLYRVNTTTDVIDRLSSSLPSSIGGDLAGLTYVPGMMKYYDSIASVLSRTGVVPLTTWELNFHLRGVSLERSSLLVDPGEIETVEVQFEMEGISSDEYGGFINCTYTAGDGETSLPVTFIIDNLGIKHDTNQNIPDNLILYPVYPNPFNSYVNIKFSVPRTDGVRVTIYDILGRETARILNRELGAGNYNVSFDGSKLASGIYFVNVSMGSVNQTRKIIHLK